MMAISFAFLGIIPAFFAQMRETKSSSLHRCGWAHFRHLFGGVTDDGAHIIYTVTEEGDLLWHRYEGDGEEDVSGHTGWHPDSGSKIRGGF